SLLSGNLSRTDRIADLRTDAASAAKRIVYENVFDPARRFNVKGRAAEFGEAFLAVCAGFGFVCPENYLFLLLQHPGFKKRAGALRDNYRNSGLFYLILEIL